MTTTTIEAPAKAGFHLSPEKVLGQIEPYSPGATDAASTLLQQNHEKWHMYFRDVAGHNHIPHAILSTLAMGGTPADLQRAYDDGEPIQRPLPPMEAPAVEKMRDPAVFRQHMQRLDQYSNFLAFFEQELEQPGSSKEAVVSRYCFSRTPLADFMLAQLFEGLYHPIIHLGFGIEFNLPGLVAEGLAQAASHDPMKIDVFFQAAEALAGTRSVASKPLVDLYRQVRASDTIRTAARLSDGPWKVRDGVLGRAFDEIVHVAAQFQVSPNEHDVQRATVEMMSCAAWACGGPHKPGKERKIDFFLMHCVTSSIFFTVLGRADWISIADKARLVEWKARLDLVWYAACAAPELRDENFLNYEPTLSRGMNWQQLYHALNRYHDDGHVAKFVRALKNAEEVALPFEQEHADILPVKGDAWLRIAQICYDSTASHTEPQKKWVWGVGFDAMWEAVPDFVTAS